MEIQPDFKELLELLKKEFIRNKTDSGRLKDLADMESLRGDETREG